VKKSGLYEEKILSVLEQWAGAKLAELCRDQTAGASASLFIWVEHV
jgi:hypothetical protein